MGKKSICVAVIVLLVVGMDSSCVKKNNPPVQTQSNTMTATVSGVAWSTGTINATSTSGLDTVSGFRSSDSSTILLQFPSNQNVGDTLNLSKSTLEYVKSNITYVWVNGSMVITSNSGNIIKGAFQGTVEDFNTLNKITIAGGSFTAKLPH